METVKPICYDLYCGLGGWAEGFLSEGYRVIGFDIEAHDYGTGGYPGELILRDVRSIHGSELKDATVIVGSSPCQEFSYRAMPWKRAKALPPPYLGMELFQAQFRIQREASEAAGRSIPMIVENVRGAQKWVGHARWHFGSYYLWGDVPALMPIASMQKFNPDGTAHPQGSWFAIADSKNRGGRKITAYSDPRRNGGKGAHLTSPSENNARLYVDRDFQGVKQHGSGHIWYRTGNGAMPSHSMRRRAASALIAKIPFPLAQHIARVFRELL
jgi:C-5 cytosine-specific DNA methylase